MANWGSFGDRVLHCRQSMLKRICCNRSNPAAGFHHSTYGGGGGGGLVSPIRSVGVLQKGPAFSLIQHCFSSSFYSSSGVAAVDKEEAGGGSPLQSGPWLMSPASKGRGHRVLPDDELDYHQYFLNFIENKLVKMKTNLMLPWQRELLPSHEAICFGSSRGWLAFIHPRNCSLYLFNPFIHSYLPYLPLPPIHTLPCIISSRRYPCHHPNDDTQSSSPSIITEFTIWDRFSPLSSQDLGQTHFFKKIALSSSPSPFPSNHHHLHLHENITCSSDHCTVMVIQGYQKSKLAFCRIGDMAWTALDGAAESYEDLMYFSKDQKFYALPTSQDTVEAWDLRNPASPKNNIIISHLPPPKQSTTMYGPYPCHHQYYLVESIGELLILVRYFHYENNDHHEDMETVFFDVYKLDFVRKEWVLMPSLGDRALFIGLNESISVPACDFPGLKKNCIYFTSGLKFGGDTDDLGFFNLEDNSTTPIYRRYLLWIVPASSAISTLTP